jgi:hypothetical protein
MLLYAPNNIAGQAEINNLHDVQLKKRFVAEMQQIILRQIQNMEFTAFPGVSYDTWIRRLVCSGLRRHNVDTKKYNNAQHALHDYRYY